MQLLHRAMQDSVTAIANGTVSSIPASIHRVHEAKGETAKALAAGRYAPPSNGGDLAGFSRLDEAFHAELVELVKAAKSGDVPATGRALGTVMSRCQDCHQRYRFAGADR
jgi:cytochrome c556